MIRILIVLILLGAAVYFGWQLFQLLDLGRKADKEQE